MNHFVENLSNSSDKLQVIVRNFSYIPNHAFDLARLLAQYYSSLSLLSCRKFSNVAKLFIQFSNIKVTGSLVDYSAT